MRFHAAPPKPPQDDPETVPPGDDSDTDPTPPLPADPGRNLAERKPSASATGAATARPPAPLDEEPALNIGERDIPTDGRDREGEGMIRDLDKPSEPPSEKPRGQTHGH